MRLWYFCMLALFCLKPMALTAQDALSYSLQRVLGQYTALYGGLQDATTLSSVIVEGTISQNDATQRFAMHRKHPNLFRYRLVQKMNSVTIGYDGRTGWVRKETGDGVEIERIQYPQIQAIREQARFESPLFESHQKNNYRYELLPNRQWDGRQVNVIEVTDAGGSQSLYFLDSPTTHVVRIDRLDASGAIQSQTLYRDYREVAGIPFAHEVEERVGGETVSLASVETVSVNPGLLSFYFELPSH